MQADLTIPVMMEQHMIAKIGSLNSSLWDGRGLSWLWMQADLAMHERMEQRMMAKVRAAEQALLDGEFSILNSSPLGRAQVERFAALNARIQELESLHGHAPAKVLLLQTLRHLTSLRWSGESCRCVSCVQGACLVLHSELYMGLRGGIYFS